MFLFRSDKLFGGGLAHRLGQTLSSQTVSGSQESVLYRLTGHRERFFTYNCTSAVSFSFLLLSLCRFIVRQTIYLGGFGERNPETINLIKLLGNLFANDFARTRFFFLHRNATLRGLTRNPS